MITKQEADELMKIPGNTKGSEIRTLMRYIRNKHGEEGVLKVEKKMEELGYSLCFGELSMTGWYRESLNVLTLLVAKEIFGWKDLYDFGYASPVLSLGIKIFIKFISARKLFEECERDWERFVDVGKLEAREINIDKKYVILRLSGYKFHPVMCSCLGATFLRLTEFTLGGKKGRLEETKCAWKGDDCDEFTIRWD